MMHSQSALYIKHKREWDRVFSSAAADAGGAVARWCRHYKKRQPLGPS